MAALSSCLWRKEGVAGVPAGDSVRQPWGQWDWALELLCLEEENSAAVAWPRLLGTQQRFKHFQVRPTAEISPPQPPLLLSHQQAGRWQWIHSVMAGGSPRAAESGRSSASSGPSSPACWATGPRVTLEPSWCWGSIGGTWLEDVTMQITSCKHHALHWAWDEPQQGSSAGQCCHGRGAREEGKSRDVSWETMESTMEEQPKCLPPALPQLPLLCHAAGADTWSHGVEPL